jgi:hypothetical protein
LVLRVTSSTTTQTGAHGTSKTLEVSYIAGTFPSEDELCVIDFYKNGDGSNTITEILGTGPGDGAPTSDDDFTIPSGVRYITAILIGGGGAGGGGATGGTNISRGGGGGGGAGAMVVVEFTASVNFGIVGYVVGAGGKPGPGATVNSPNSAADGINGYSGGSTVLGLPGVTYVAPGGGGGGGGIATNQFNAQSGFFGIGGGGTTDPLPVGEGTPSNPKNTSQPLTGGLGYRFVAGSRGGAGGKLNQTATPSVSVAEYGQTTIYGATGGGGGAGIVQFAPQDSLGSRGGNLLGQDLSTNNQIGSSNAIRYPRMFLDSAGDLMIGAAQGANGTSLNGGYVLLGMGGGGGKSTINGIGQDGGDGGLYGGGGGGGGAGFHQTNGVRSGGNGGKGGPGYLLLLGR